MEKLKRLFTIALFIFAVFSLGFAFGKLSAPEQVPAELNDNAEVADSKIMVYYFHATKR